MPKYLCLDCKLVEIGEWESCCSDCQVIRDRQDAEEQAKIDREMWIESFEVREDSEYHFGGPNRG